MPFVKNPQPFKNYRIIFYLSGMDKNGNPITDHSCAYRHIREQGEERAKEKLKSLFYESVEVNITICEEITD